MNCAEMVCAGPELPGEAIDPKFQRWISGLGITKTNTAQMINGYRYK